MSNTPKYQVGDILYRKDTQKKSKIDQIVQYIFGPSENPYLCYVVSEPLNFQPCVSDHYLRVDYIDTDNNYCDFKNSGVPKYQVGDVIKWSHAVNDGYSYISIVEKIDDGKYYFNSYFPTFCGSYEGKTEVDIDSVDNNSLAFKFVEYTEDNEYFKNTLLNAIDQKQWDDAEVALKRLKLLDDCDKTYMLKRNPHRYIIHNPIVYAIKIENGKRTKWLHDNCWISALPFCKEFITKEEAETALHKLPEIPEGYGFATIDEIRPMTNQVMDVILGHKDVNLESLLKQELSIISSKRGLGGLKDE